MVTISEKYVKELIKQCRRYAKDEDVAQEMMLLVWKSYTSGNGLSHVVKEKKLIPSWQLRLLYLHALRNLFLLHSSDDVPLSPTLARAIYNENGEIVDFFFPEEHDEEEQENQNPERKKMLRKIRKLKKRGYTDEKIVQILKKKQLELI